MGKQSRRIEMTGRQFGRLQVERYARTTKADGAVWLCKCSCGNSKEIAGKSLRRGITVSCGCATVERNKSRRGSKNHRYQPIEQRLLDKITPEPNSGCWLWTGFVHPSGYGVIRTGNKNTYAHRCSYELFVGAVPEGLQLDHICRVRCCVNPAHLEPVTPQENVLRGLNGRLRYQKADANA